MEPSAASQSAVKWRKLQCMLFSLLSSSSSPRSVASGVGWPHGICINRTKYVSILPIEESSGQQRVKMKSELSSKWHGHAQFYAKSNKHRIFNVKRKLWVGLAAFVWKFEELEIMCAGDLEWSIGGDICDNHFWLNFTNQKRLSGMFFHIYFNAHPMDTFVHTSNRNRTISRT